MPARSYSAFGRCTRNLSPPFGLQFPASGRFDGASGTWTSEYSGDNLEAESGFRTVTGTFQGTLEMP